MEKEDTYEHICLNSYMLQNKRKGVWVERLANVPLHDLHWRAAGARENRIGDSYDFLLNGLTESSNPAQSHSFHNKINKQNTSQKNKLSLPLLESSTNHTQNN
jgi:hypothetical protein